MAAFAAALDYLGALCYNECGNFVKMHYYFVKLLRNFQIPTDFKFILRYLPYNGNRKQRQ